MSQFTIPITELMVSPSNPDARVDVITRSDAGHGVYLATRAELTKYLLRLLPERKTPPTG